MAKICPVDLSVLPELSAVDVARRPQVVYQRRILNGFEVVVLWLWVASFLAESKLMIDFTSLVCFLK